MKRLPICLLLALLGACSDSTPPVDPIVAKSAPYIGFLEHDLLKPTGVGATRALAETASELGEERWFWTDDNAKALELFALPALNAAHPQTARDLLSFVEAMSAGQAIYRRAGLPQLAVQSADPARIDLSAGFLNLKGNLRQDELTLSMRYHDGRTQDAMRFGAHAARFNALGRAHVLSAQANAEYASVIVRADGLRLLLRASLMDTTSTPPKRLARMWLRYDFALGDPWFNRTLDFKVFTEGGANGVEVTLGLNQLDQLATRFNQLCMHDRGGPVRCEVPRSALTLDAPGQYLMVANRDSMGFSYALTVAPSAPPLRIQSTGSEAAINRVEATYALGTFRQGEKKSIRERLLFSNGQINDSAQPLAALADAAPAALHGLDLSISYDYGAELNAVACYRWQISKGKQRAHLREWFDRHYAQFATAAARPATGDLRSAVMTRGLSFALLGLDCMARAEPNAPSYAQALKVHTAQLLALQINAADDQRRGVFEGGAVAGVYLDTHAAAMLALARMTLRRDAEPATHDALRRGLAALQISANGGAQLITDARDAGVLTQDQWSYSAGLLARAMTAVLLSASAGHLALSDEEQAKAQALQSSARAAIARAFKVHQDRTEILTQAYASEGNSETQPWALLGLLDFDQALLGL